MATGAYLLASVAAEAALRDAKKDKPVSRAVAGLPVGAWMILGNCCVYAVTSRLDKAAVRAAGKTLYYAAHGVEMIPRRASRDSFHFLQF